MFEVFKGTELLVIKDERGVEWRSENFRRWVARNDNLFDKADMCIDPTGIATWCPPLNGVTIGSAYARAGWYGFRSQGYVVLVPRCSVIYVD